MGRTSGRPALSRGARVFPRGAPGVAATSGRSGGWRCPGCARHPGTSQGGVNPEVRPKKKKKCSVFMIFGLFWLTFAWCVSDFAVFGSVFQKKSRDGGTSGCPWGRAARGASPPRATGRIAVPGVIPTSGTTPAGAPEMHPTPPRAGVVVHRTSVVLCRLKVVVLVGNRCFRGRRVMSGELGQVRTQDCILHLGCVVDPSSCATGLSHRGESRGRARSLHPCSAPLTVPFSRPPGPRQPPSLAPAAGSSELPARGARRPGSGAAVALAAV